MTVGDLKRLFEGTDYHKANSEHCAYVQEGFADCYGKECPFYDIGYCKRVLKKGGAK